MIKWHPFIRPTMKRWKIFILAILSASILFVAVPIHSIQGENGILVGKEYLIRESAKISDIGMGAARDALLTAFNENVTEAQVVRSIEQAMINSGSSEQVEAFGVQVASGDQSAIPHGDSSDDKTNLILPGEVVVVDLGARYGGYCSDISRTFFMGPPTSEMMEVYNITLEAQEAGIDSVRAGALARDVDKAARDIISDHGYGDNFTHGLGHGIGVYIHMPPTLYPDSNGILIQSTDMAITIEPGIYLDGRWGVRIEDDLMVTRSGSDIITHFPKDLASISLLPDEQNNLTIPNEIIETSNEKGSIQYLVPLMVIFIFVPSVIVLIKKFRK
jgi:Xaa-Pro aminopeptidase